MNTNVHMAKPSFQESFKKYYLHIVHPQIQNHELWVLVSKWIGVSYPNMIRDFVTSRGEIYRRIRLMSKVGRELIESRRDIFS